MTSREFEDGCDASRRSSPSGHPATQFFIRRHDWAIALVSTELITAVEQHYESRASLSHRMPTGT